MTFLAGQPIFNSIHEKQNWGCRIEDVELTIFFFNTQRSMLNSQLVQYLVWISLKHLVSISSFAQNICAMTGDWSLSVNKCLITPVGLIIYPSAFINSVRNHKVYFSFSPYISKISFTIWRKAQSVNQSMGASQSIMKHTVRKLKKISSKKINELCYLEVDCISLNEVCFQRVLWFNKDEGEIDEGFFGFFFYLGEKKKRLAGEAIEKCIS